MTILSKVRDELRTLGILARTGRAVATLRADGTRTVADDLEASVDRAPDAEAIRWEGRAISYRELDEAGNRVAAWAASRGLGPGDVVALLMENRPEYIATWFGLAKVGVQAALINTNLTGQPLAHALRVSGAQDLIVGAELAAALDSIGAEADRPKRVWVHGGEHAGAKSIDGELAEASVERPPATVRDGVRSGDNLFFIYTSGTTGLPKAARFSHMRFMQVGRAYTGLAGITASDKIYCVLPLYHTAGGVMTVSMALLNGATLVLRRKFSASSFWQDCRDNGVTVFQYIGELCRYLLNAPARDDDRVHSVRCAIGNGLRPDIWEAFRTRFAITEIREFYGATEGNFALVNVDNKVGAVGRVPWYAKSTVPVDLVRYDVESDSHPRGDDGFCLRCGPEEVGEAIGRIPAKESAGMGRFEGYGDDAATARKILHDVFETGDSWYRTGDLLRRDASGYYYFVDRIGDTFRWKGENVATSEVAEVLSVFDGVREANVYGVAVPGADGRAGMAALVADPDLDLAGLYCHVERELAAYARPIFLRLSGEMETTGTFKHRKVDLVRDGFDPAAVGDPLYVLDAARGAYVELDDELLEELRAGRLRV